MSKEEIAKLILNKTPFLSVSEIETELKLPRTTLQKFLKGQRVIPKKFVKIVNDYFYSGVVLNIPENKSVEEKQGVVKSEMPIRMEGEGFADFAFRKSQWKANNK